MEPHGALGGGDKLLHLGQPAATATKSGNIYHSNPVLSALKSVLMFDDQMYIVDVVVSIHMKIGVNTRNPKVVGVPEPKNLII